MGEVLRCTRCSDVIGVYEPAVIVDRDGIHHTSIAAHGRDAFQHGEAHYHRACYETWFRDGPKAIPPVAASSTRLSRGGARKIVERAPKAATALE